MFRTLFNSYVVLILISCLVWFNLWLEVGVSFAWLAFAAFAGRRAACQGIPMQRVLWLGWMSQLPGLVLGSYGVASICLNAQNELAAGAQEVWVHPFVPFLELVLPNRPGHWSLLYLVTCGLPFVVGMVPALAGLIFGIKHSNRM